MHTEFNIWKKKINFMDNDNKMDFLDITTSNSRSRLELYILLKPTTTDNTVLWPIIAVIPQNIKHAVISYFATTMNQYPTRNAKRYTEYYCLNKCNDLLFKSSLKLATWL